MFEENKSIIQGESFRIAVSLKLTDTDPGLVNAQLIVFGSNNLIAIVETSGFSLNSETGEYESDLTTTDTDISPGTYQYFVKINWDDGTNDVIPDLDDCSSSDTCEYPSVTVCIKPAVDPNNPDDDIVTEDGEDLITEGPVS